MGARQERTKEPDLVVLGDHIVSLLFVQYLVYLRLALRKFPLEFLMHICWEVITLGETPLDVPRAPLDLVQGNAELRRVAIGGWLVARKVAVHFLVWEIIL
jgi:hypothetical protein